MRTNRWLILAVAAVLALALAAVGQEHRDQQRGPNQTFAERYGQQLSLTDQQKTKIDEIEKQFQKDNADFLSTFQKTMSDFRAARQANDSAKVEALRPSVDSQRAQMTKLRTALEDKFAATFDEAQQKQWTKIKEERETRMKERSSGQ